MRAQNNVTPIPAREPNPLERAFDTYTEMEERLRDTEAKNQELLVQNMNFLAEVQMLREALDRSDADRIRLQAVSSTLLGRLLSINDVIGGAVRASIKDGIQAVAEAKQDPALDQAASEAAAIIQRVEPMAPAQPPKRMQGAVGLPVVDLGLPQNDTRQ